MIRSRLHCQAACERRICDAINRLIQAESVEEQTKANWWIKAWIRAWELHFFYDLSQETPWPAIRQLPSTR